MHTAPTHRPAPGPARLLWPTMVTPMFHHHLLGDGQRAVTALRSGEVDDHRAGLHFRDSGGMQQGRCLAARNQRGGDDDVSQLGLLVHRLGLTLHPRSRHRPRVAANALGAFALFIGLERHIDELGAERFDLLFKPPDARPKLRSPHPGAWPWRWPCKPATPAPRIRMRAALTVPGSGHQHRHKARIVVRRQQHGFVAGDVGLRREHVQALRAGGTRMRPPGRRPSRRGH